MQNVLTVPFFALQLTIYISDENDNPPVFTQDIYTKTIPENVPQGYSVTQVNTSDADIGINAEHSFTITGLEPFKCVLNTYKIQLQYHCCKNLVLY